MLVSGFRAVIDASVLFSHLERDLLLRAARLELFQPYWTHEILEETRRNLVARGKKTAAQAEAFVKELSGVEEATVEGYEIYIASMRNDPKDRHVAAAAVACGAEVSVTSNLKDFVDLPAGKEAKSPDEFLCLLFEIAPQAMMDSLRAQAALLKRPPMSFLAYIDKVEQLLPRLGAAVRARMS